MREVLNVPLAELDALSQSLLRSLAPAASSLTKPPPPPTIAAFLSADAKLAAAVQQARIHQAKQRRIEELTEEVLELDGRLRDVIAFLAKGKEELAEILREGKERIEGMERAEKGEHNRQASYRVMRL